MTLSKAQRQSIIDEHLDAYGDYKPLQFVEDASDPEHPAHRWFEWDDAVAGHEYRIWQARQFVSTLRVTVKTNVTKITGGVRVVMATRPVAVSEGKGCYIPTDTREGKVILTRQALAQLESWLGRYESVVEIAGCREQIDGAIAAISAIAKKAAA